MTDQDQISLWNRSAVEKDFSASLDGDAKTDVAIVGGGYTGLSTALHGAERGLDCLVLEARQIGYGGSGRNAGLLNAGVWLPPQDVRAVLGEQRGSRLVSVLGDGPAYVMSLIEKHQIRCELTRTGTIHAAHSTRGFRDLERRAAEWQRLGAPVELLTREEAAAKIGSWAYHGGLLDHRAGTLNPMGYVRGLARAARAAGARIATGVTVIGLEREGDGWRLITDRGTVIARRVVLGTNAYTDTLWPGLKDSVTLIHFFQVATVPICERLKGILEERQGVWDTAKVMISLRRDGSDRLIIGSMGQVMGRVSHRWAARQLARIFPELGPVEFEEAWHGQIAMTPNHLPHIHRLADGLYTPIGYNGRGIAPGTVFGRAMASLLADGHEEELPLPVTGVAPAPRKRLTQGFYRAMFAANQIIRSF